MKTHRIHTPAGIVLAFIAKDLTKLESDASAQYKFNRFFAVFWFCFMTAVPFFPTLYGHQISALLIQEISFWANFATHFGAMSAALAARNTDTTVKDIAEDVSDISENVDDINDVTDKLDPVLPDPNRIKVFNEETAQVAA